MQSFIHPKLNNVNQTRFLGGHHSAPQLSETEEKP